jgi:hypothetical protein
VSDNAQVSSSFDPSGQRVLNKYVDSETPYRAALWNSQPAAFITSASVPVETSFAFAVNQFNQYNEYTSLFDQYRILQIECWLSPTAVLTNQAVSDITSAVDIDDSNPSTFAGVSAHSNAIVTGGMNGHYHKWVPHCAVAAYGSSVFTSFSNVQSPWIDSASLTVSHFGLKIASAIGLFVVNYNLNTRIIVEFRNPGL